MYVSTLPEPILFVRGFEVFVGIIFFVKVLSPGCFSKGKIVVLVCVSKMKRFML